MRKLCYNKDTESTDDGCSHKIDENNRLMWKSGGYLFYFLSLLLKNFNNKSAKAINDVIINNSSVKVMYFILSPPLKGLKGESKRFAPFYERKGKQPPSVSDALRHACNVQVYSTIKAEKSQ